MTEFKISISPPEDEKPKINIIETNISDEIAFKSIEEEIENNFNSKGIYFRELNKLNKYLNGYNKRMKDLIIEIHENRKNNFDLKNQISSIDNDILLQIENQKNVLSSLENENKEKFEEKKKELNLINEEILKLKKNKNELLEKKKKMRKKCLIKKVVK